MKFLEGTSFQGK